jgi:hypothetical protein
MIKVVGRVAEGSDLRPSARWLEDRPPLWVEYPGFSMYCTKFRNFLVRKSRQKFRSRSSDDADKSWWNLRGMAGRFRIGPEDFVSGRVLRDRYDKVLRPSFIK